MAFILQNRLLYTKGKNATELFESLLFIFYVKVGLSTANLGF